MFAVTLIDELTYRCYRFNRKTSPVITPQQWASIFTDTAAMEQRFQREESRRASECVEAFAPLAGLGESDRPCSAAHRSTFDWMDREQLIEAAIELTADCERLRRELDDATG